MQTAMAPAPPTGVSRETMWHKLLKVDKSLATTRAANRNGGAKKFGNPMSLGELGLSMGMAATWGALFRAQPGWKELFGGPGQSGIDTRAIAGFTTLGLSLFKPTRKFIPKWLQVSVPMSMLIPWSYDSGGDLYETLMAA